MRLAAILALSLAAGAAHAQSCYIDLDTAFGAGYGEPSGGFNGPAGLIPAYWSYITDSTPVTSPVRNLKGDLTPATLTRATNGTFTSFNSPNTWGDYKSFFDDYQELPSGTMTYTFNNLEPGTYAVYTSAVHPANANNRCTVSVANPAEYCQVSQTVGGPLVQFNTIRTYLRAGITHALHIKRVAAGSPLTITITDGFNSSAVCNGIQLVKLPGERLRMYVKSGATQGLNDGGTWQNAFTDLQSALDAARAAGGQNCEIWVATGLYKPTQGADRSATFSIPSGLRLYGGFAGNETTLAQRTSPLFYNTILSGSIGSPAATDDSYTVVTLNNVNSNTVVDGFYIARGYNNGGPYSGYGGGMVVDYGIGPTIRNCDFTTNTAALGGGALHLRDSSVQVINCTFYKSNVYNGAGGAIDSVGPMRTTLTLQNSRFLGNHALGDGGAIYTNFVHAEIANCLFSGNSSDNEGGAIKSVGDAQHLRLWNNTFSRNSAGRFTGGVFASGGLHAELHNNIFWGNTGELPASLSAHQFTATLGSTQSGSHNTVEGLDANPLFVNAAGPDGIPGNFDDDLRLTQASPCIDSGDGAALPLDIDDLNANGITNESIPFDLAGDPRRVEVPSVPNTGAGGNPPLDRGCFEFQLARWCYVNCDNSSVAPVLNVRDFACFLNSYAAGDAYANCDGSTTPPVLNVLDFACFLNRFAAGCP